MDADPIARLLADPPELPVRAGLAAVVAAVRARGVAVVQAPPGTGKTTLVPPALAAVVEGTVVVTQPRRIAARAAARRLAELLGEPVGRTVGYAVRGERRVSARTRVEIVTTGVLLRRLQRDPELPGVGAVVLDECHERHLDGDLALAMLVDVRRHLRPELVLVAMSATVEAARTAELLGTGSGSPDRADGPDPAHDARGPSRSAAPVITVEGALFPVDAVWCPPPAGVARTDERGVTPAFLDHVARTVRRALAERTGDVLVFVPGAGEIAGVARRLGGVDADVRPLHGRLPPQEQDRALAVGVRRRVVVSTAVAESSLTVPGVRVVVDAGLAREPRTDHRRGLAGLVTVSASRAASRQRAGRAGREGPGAVYRCWSPEQDVRLPEHPEPEIRTADLTAFALELACWGSPDGTGLALMDAPPAAAMAVARSTLVGLGAVGPQGAVTERGRAISGVGADPRLARALIDAAPVLGTARAAEVVALLSADVRGASDDLVATLRALRRGGPDAAAWRAEASRLRGALDRSPDDDGGGGSSGLPDDLAVGLVVALAHPDRIARRRPTGSSYLMASGTGAGLGPGTALTGLAWLAVADADRGAGRRDATVRSAAPLDEDLAREAAPSLLRVDDEVTWADGQVLARRTTRLGAIELRSEPLTTPSAAAVVAAVREGLRQGGLTVLPWSEASRTLRARLAFLHRVLGEPWPDVSDEALLRDLDSWLGPDLARVRRVGDLRRLDLVGALRRLLPWPQAGRLDELAPEHVQLPGGTRARLDYDGDQPVLAVPVQRVFGWRTAPLLADGRVPVLLHLLSPARRPVAVTADLASFWRTGYPQVRAELRRRYPKHDWPPDPTTATPTARRGS
ncbi:ATP-dependent helicase [Actinomycetota bacterium]|nr:ATP-dependent helicase [Actinomycetota bacterium]